MNHRHSLLLLLPLLLAVFSVFPPSVRAQGEIPPSVVVDLTDSDIGQLEKGEWLIEFYAPWCAACHRFKGFYDLAAFMVFDHDPSIQLAKVNVDDNPGLSSQFFAFRLPAFYHIKDGQVREARIRLDTPQGAIDYLKRQEWKNSKVWDNLFSPFSTFGHFMNRIGRSAKYIVDHREDIKRGALYVGVAWLAYIAFAKVAEVISLVKVAIPVAAVEVDEPKKTK
ncbi:hypothetical protein BC936DRAFT_138566 [Jimgerdemannia flammicorona]|uniref:Thioredoxin domain-containing protein n=1 Tax=Jimgerdemannia flammicorona TaxID=994334 RepID=A0A433DI93_9FUNG|nr:hypothetical protein BC936DRAFT_138566 [Jimgerdemannia flammicorona]